jgi:hypothetical protein
MGPVPRPAALPAGHGQVGRLNVALVLEVAAHATGPWLVKAGSVQYAVPPRLGQALLPLAGRIPECRELRACLVNARTGHADEVSLPEIETWVRELSRALTPGFAVRNGLPRGRQARRIIRFRVPLIPASLVGRITVVLQALAGNRGLAAMGLLGGAGYLVAGYLFAAGGGGAGSGQVGFSWDLGTAATGLGLFMLTAVWHELGHAAALARSGYRPGGIGAGLLFVIPVLFADVTPVGALPRAGRIRVDVSGTVFQLGLGGVFMVLAGWGIFAPALTLVLALAGSSALLAICWSLFPFIRSDGYWLLCDMLELEDLDRPPSKPISNRLRVFLVGYQLTNAAFLLMVGVYFPFRMFRLLLGLAHRLGIPLDSDTTKWVAAAAGVAFLGMMGVGITRRIWTLVRSARSVAKRPPGGVSQFH